jgi:CRP/FNR family transcriptional regulator
VSDKIKTIDFSRYKATCETCSLNSLCLPGGLSEDEMKRLEHTVKRHRPIQKGEALYRVGDKCRSLYTVRSGSIKSYMTTNSGDEQIMGFHLPGELFGLDGLDTEQFTCTGIALETTSVCELPLREIEGHCSTIPGLNHQMHRLMGKQVTMEHEMLLLLGKKHAEERLSSFLLGLSTRYSLRGFSAYDFNLSMSRQDIGNYLGLALETVSRQFSHLEDLGVIKVDRRHVTIKDLEKLKQLAVDPHPIICNHPVIK